VRILFFDFNGEYSRENCLTTEKTVYNLSTRHDQGDKVPLSNAGFLDFETIAILADATEKTQRPFIRRALDEANRIGNGLQGQEHLHNILRMQIKQILQMADKERATLLIDYMRQVLPERVEEGVRVPLEIDLEWHNMMAEFKGNGTFLRSNPDEILNTELYRRVESFQFANDIILDFISICYVHLSGTC